MNVIRNPVTLDELKKISERKFDRFVKAVVDIEQNIMAIDAALHADEENLLLEEENSQQENLWGINLYPFAFDDPSWIQFDSMINIRPSQGNRNRSIENPAIQAKIRTLVAKLVVP